MRVKVNKIKLTGERDLIILLFDLSLKIRKYLPVTKF